MNTPLLRVRHVAWQTPDGAEVLREVSLDVVAGEFVAVMGRNGAGKSTLLDVMAGLRAPTEGSVAIDGRPLDDWHPMERARTLAHLPQMLRADLSMRAEALVLMGRYPHAVHWLESDRDTRIAHDAMARCECLAFRHRIVSTLSGGERQRVLLAACLAQEARILLLDEPATFLDVDQQLECFGVVRREAERGAACVAVTHDVNLALTFCTRLVVLADRGIARDISAEDALTEPAWLRAFTTRVRIEHRTTGTWVQYR